MQTMQTLELNYIYKPEEYCTCFAWVEQDQYGSDTAKYPVFIKGSNIFNLLKNLMLQAKQASPSEKINYKLAPQFKTLLSGDSLVNKDFANAIEVWAESIPKKNPEDLEADLENLRLKFQPNATANKDLDGHTPLHRAIIAKNKKLIDQLIAESTPAFLALPDSFYTYGVQHLRGGRIAGIKEFLLVREKTYLHYLVEHLSFQEFQEIWEKHSDKLKPLASLTPKNLILDSVFQKRAYNFADFLVAHDFSLSLEGSCLDVDGGSYYTFSLPDTSEEQIEHINRFLKILENQKNKISSQTNLPVCLKNILHYCCKDIVFQHVFNHPYILANQAILDECIKFTTLADILSSLSNESNWKYFLTKRPLSEKELDSLIKNTIQKDNLPLLQYLEKNYNFKLEGPALIKATNAGAVKIIEFLIKEKMVDPGKKIGSVANLQRSW